LKGADNLGRVGVQALALWQRDGLQSAANRVGSNRIWALRGLHSLAHVLPFNRGTKTLFNSEASIQLRSGKRGGRGPDFRMD
jgi:hypothetical protein